MKKNIILAFVSYLFLFIVGLGLYKYVSNVDLAYLIFIPCCLSVSFVIIIIKKPYCEQRIQKEDTLNNSRFIRIIKFSLLFWVFLTIILKIIIGIKAERFLFPWHPDKTVGHYCIFYFSYLVGALAEELLFRYLIYKEILSKKICKLLAIVVTSLLFSFYHNNQSVFEFIIRFVMGLQFNLLFEFYPSIVFVSGYHFLSNILVFIF